MRIGEVSNIVGLDVSSIRFYERKGLINPDRGEDNKYRDYSLEDIECLKQIVLLRKLDMSKAMPSGDAHAKRRSRLSAGSLDPCFGRKKGAGGSPIYRYDSKTIY